MPLALIQVTARAMGQVRCTIAPFQIQTLIRYPASKPAGSLHDLELQPRSRFMRIHVQSNAGIQNVSRHLADHQARTEAIAAEVRDAVGQGRRVLVQTECTERLNAIKAALDGS